MARLDAVLSIYLAAEVLLVLVMCRASAGAWINYGIQAVVFASVLAARALARTCASATSPLARSAIGLAAFTLLVGVCNDAASNARSCAADRLGLAAIAAHYRAARRRVLLRGSTRYQSPERQARPGL